MKSNNNNVKSFCIVMLLGLFWKMSHRQLQVSAGKTKSYFSPIVLLSLWGIKEILMEDVCERYISTTFLSSGACRMLSADTAHCRASDQSCVQVDIVSPATLSKVLALCCFPPACLVDLCVKKMKGFSYYILEIKKFSNVSCFSYFLFCFWNPSSPSTSFGFPSIFFLYYYYFSSFWKWAAAGPSLMECSQKWQVPC